MHDFIVYEPKDINIVRLRHLQKRMQNRKASICSQRAVLYTASFKQSEGEPYILRKAKAFAYTLRNMDIYIEPDSLIFGNQASRNFAAPIFPEYSIDWVINELDEFEKREGDVFSIDEKTKRELRLIAPYWHGHTHEDDVNRHMIDNILLAEKQGVIHRGGISMSGDGHIVPDYPTLLKKGFRQIINEAREKMKDGSLSKEQEYFYKSVIISLEGVLDFFKRYSKLADEEAKKCNDLIRKKELLEIADMASDMMEQGARNFYEAVEVSYMVHMLQMIESNGHSFCYGRFDQYMYPYYKKDLKDGKITKDQALEIITHMFIMNSSCNKVRPYGHTKFSQGYPLYSNLVVGGLKPNGEDGTNDLSYLCIEAMNLTALAEPNFSARIHAKTPRKFIEACAKLIRTGCGMPSMFNDEVASKGLEDLGISHEDALDYCPIGCVETGVPGKYGHRATGMTYVNWGKVLEILLHNGYDPNTKIRLLKVSDSESMHSNFKNYNELWQTWENFLKYYSDLSVECDKICDTYLAKYDASPFASCLIQNSMKLGKTLKEGGCKYDVISQSNIGPSVVGNSLMSIKKMVFDENKITFDELLDAMDDNWTSKKSQYIRKLCMKTPKFGNDNDEVDEEIEYKNIKKKKKTKKKKILLILKILFFLILLFVIFIFLFFKTSLFQKYKELWVETAMSTMNHQFLATWFLSEDEINKILKKSEVQNNENSNSDNVTISNEKEKNKKEISLEKITGKNYVGFVMTIPDASKVKLVDGRKSSRGSKLSEIVTSNNAIAGINAGGFSDDGGVGAGNLLNTATIMNKTLQYGNKTSRYSFIGLSSDSKLVLGKYTYQEALNHKIESAIEFGPYLIVNGKNQISNSNSGRNPT